MIGVDTNILVYAHRAEMREHEIALENLRKLAEGNDLWAISWSSCYEFFRVVTHSQIFSPASRPLEALSFLEVVFACPSVRLLSHGVEHGQWMKKILLESDISASIAFDAQITAILIENGVSEIMTADADFHRFKGLTVINPFRHSGT